MINRTRFIVAFLAAAELIVGAAHAGPLDDRSAQALPDALASPADSGKLEIGMSIAADAKFVDIVIASVTQDFSDPKVTAGLSDADRQRLIDMTVKEIVAHKGAIDRALVEGEVNRFTLEQLRNIKAVSQLKISQEVILSGAGLGPRPAESTITPSEQATLTAYSSQPYFFDFMQNMDRARGKAEAQVAVADAVARFKATLPH